MEIKIFTKSNKEEYNGFLLENNLSLDIYYYMEFLGPDALLHKGEFEIFTARENNSVFIYPYILMPVSEVNGYYDLTSPYGYCGPYSTDTDIFKKCEPLLVDHFAKNVISEFVRYHILYNSERKFEVNIENVQNRKVMFLNLDQSWEQIWESEFSTTNRNLVRKLHKEGYLFNIVNFEDNIEEFIEMYYLTMDNAKAGDYYYFDKEYFYNLKKNLGEKLILAKIVKENITYNSSLFFNSGGILTYYLSSRNLAFPKVPSNNLLLSEAVKWAAEQKLSYFNFGGGRTNSPEDSLFKFKRNFTNTTLDFYIGKRIHNREAYNTIIEKWVKEKGKEKFDKVKHMLQFYRN